jgi:hypothetical protein
MIDKINQQKNISDLSAKKTDAVNTKTAVNVSKSSASTAINTPRSAASLASAFGLPQDKLSSSIISFAKFFSLPLKPQLLTDLRRYAFAPHGVPHSQTANQSSASANASATKGNLANTNAAGDTTASLSAEKTRYALSLSAAAVESKGVELTQKGLESYAQSVDPDSRRQDGDRQRRRRDREQDEQTEKTSSKTEAVKKSQHGESFSPQPFTADGFKKMSFEYVEQNPLLKILNRLPCKNGQRWVVLPFDFDEGEKNYSVSMRVLLDDEHSVNHAVCMVLDILETENSDNERRWLFVTESVNDKPLRVSVYLQHELSQKNHSKFKNELSNLFNVPSEHINIINSAEPFPYESSFADNFSLVDEVV